MDYSKFISLIKKNKKHLRKFMNPSDELVKKIRNKLAERGLEYTPEQVKSHLKTIETTLKQIDKDDSNEK